MQPLTLAEYDALIATQEAERAAQNARECNRALWTMRLITLAVALIIAYLAKSGWSYDAPGDPVHNNLRAYLATTLGCFVAVWLAGEWMVRRLGR
jgi:hypothetical protein